MATLFLHFLSGRYHATPWGHHVNEGLVEWPPSPWRLLRALLSVGYTSGLWNGNGPTVEARSLIEKLASVLPTYGLPLVSGAHSRHYMPLARFKNGREETTLVFDTWAQVDDGQLAVTWDVQLSEAETELFGRLTGRLGYLGRAESWVTARMAKADESIPASNCFHESIQANPGPGWEQVPLMAPETQADFTQWRAQAVAQALTEFPLPENKKPSKKLLNDRDKAAEPYPSDLIDCLQKETNWLRKYGWSQPPGSRRVFYWRKADALEAGAPKSRKREIEPPAVEVMLLAMATASGIDHALPSVIRTVPQADLLHRALVQIASRSGGMPGKVLTGCDESGKPLTEPHRHAHLLPLDLDDDGHLDHVLIWAPMGLDASAQAAVRGVRATFTKGGVAPLRLALTGSGSLADLGGLPGVYGEKLRGLIGPSGATEWRSLTPFVPPRFLKKRGKNTLEGQVIAELVTRGHPEPIDIRVLDSRKDTRLLRMRHFVRSRRFGPAAPIDCGFSLALRFAQPLKGPLCLGYGSHFGLGMFSTLMVDHGGDR